VSLSRRTLQGHFTHYTVNKVPAYNIGGDSELVTNGPENSE